MKPSCCNGNEIRTISIFVVKKNLNKHCKVVKQAVCDRGYRGKTDIEGTKIILPKKPLKKTTAINVTKNENNAKDARQ